MTIDQSKILEKIFVDFVGTRDEIIPLLQKTQNEFGFLSKEAMRAIAKFTRVPESNVYGVATFYSQFRFSPLGTNHATVCNHITVCRGTACQLKGSSRILEEIKSHLGVKEEETTPDGKYSLSTVACLGCCGLAPCLTVNGRVEAKITTQKIADLFPQDNKK